MEYLFDDVFSVKDVDMDGKKFDKGTFIAHQFFQHQHHGWHLEIVPL